MRAAIWCPVANKVSQSQGFWAIRLFGLNKLGRWLGCFCIAMTAGMSDIDGHGPPRHRGHPTRRPGCGPALW